MISNDPDEITGDNKEYATESDGEDKKAKSQSSLKERTDEDRKKHAFYSRRNYYKTKANLEELRLSSYDKRAQNIELQAENQRLQGLLACAQNIVAQLHPASQPPLASALPMSSPGPATAFASVPPAKPDTWPKSPPTAIPTLDSQASQIVHQMLSSIQQLATLQRPHESVATQPSVAVAPGVLPMAQQLQHFPASVAPGAQAASLIPGPALPPTSLPHQVSASSQIKKQKFKLTSPLDLNILVPLLGQNSDEATEASMERLVKVLTSTQNKDATTNNKAEKRIAEDLLPASSASNELLQISVTVDELHQYLMCLTSVIQKLKRQHRAASNTENEKEEPK